MKMKSINPFSNTLIAEFQTHNQDEVSQIIHEMNASFVQWKDTSIQERCKFVGKLGTLLESQKTELAMLITNEMGKPIREATAEIEKCALLCRYHSKPENAGLDPILVETEAEECYVGFEPLGIIFAIMPWNFPFWQVMRFAVPNLVAGNAALLKHAPNVSGCALAIEKLFSQAGFHEQLFRVVIIPHEEVEPVIANPLVKGVTLTGSGRAGKSVASLAGKYLKKSVLELGGSDPFIVFADADIGNSCMVGIRSRMNNAGQVCISAKRFFVEAGIMDEFTGETISLIEGLKVGDPRLTETDIGPMARPDLVDQIEKQVNDSINLGAKLLYGGHRHPDNPMIYLPTLLTGVTHEMPVMNEETFGPVSVLIPFQTTEEAIRRANSTNFGLTASVWTGDINKAKYVANHLQAGAVFINSMTRSDPRLPFGGIKESGFGRELSSFGIREFCNVKTYWID